MNAKDNSKLQTFIDSLAESSSSGNDGLATIEFDINLGDDSRLTVIKTASGDVYVSRIYDSEAGEHLTAQLTTYPPPSSSSSSSGA